MKSRRLVYVLESISEPSRHYVGLTSNVAGRLDEHNAGKAAHTLKHRPWRLRAAIEFGDPANAARLRNALNSAPGVPLRGGTSDGAGR
jgi:predicted GIY-YIG superfamily endonuclease